MNSNDMFDRLLTEVTDLTTKIQEQHVRNQELMSINRGLTQDLNVAKSTIAALRSPRTDVPG